MLESNPEWDLGGFHVIKFNANNETVTQGLHSGAANFYSVSRLSFLALSIADTHHAALRRAHRFRATLFRTRPCTLSALSSTLAAATTMSTLPSEEKIGISGCVSPR